MNIAFTQGKEEMMLPASSVYVPSMGNKTVEDLLNELNFKVGVSDAYPHVQIKDSVVADDSTYSSQKIESIAGGNHTYSTDEQIVGTWIDGSYIYEKTVNLGQDVELVNGQWTDLPNTEDIQTNHQYLIQAFALGIGQNYKATRVIEVADDGGHGVLIGQPMRNGNDVINILVIQYTKST